MRIRPGNAQALGDREAQEDSFAFSDPGDTELVGHGGLLAVLGDGMGGLAHGAAASRAAVRAFLGAYGAKTAGESIAEALDRSLRAAQRAVVELGGEISPSEPIGTTLVAAVVHDGALHWISAGDSRIYLVRGQEVAQLTRDHVYGERLREEARAGRISEREALEDPLRDSLTSYLGGEGLAEIDQNARPLPLRAGDRVILCSDGLYRALAPEEITAALGDDPHRTCEALVETALARRLERQDNVTVLMWSCEEEARDSPAPERPPSRLLATVLWIVLVGLAIGIGGSWWWRTAERGAARVETSPP